MYSYVCYGNRGSGKGRKGVRSLCGVWSPHLSKKKACCSPGFVRLLMNPSIIFWNVRGLGRTEKKSVVKDVVCLSKAGSGATASDFVKNYG